MPSGFCGTDLDLYIFGGVPGASIDMKVSCSLVVKWGARATHGLRLSRRHLHLDKDDHILY